MDQDRGADPDDGQRMPRKRDTAEQIITKLRQAEIAIARGQPVAEGPPDSAPTSQMLKCKQIVLTVDPHALMLATPSAFAEVMSVVAMALESGG